jgi:hypothetical protein
MKENTLAAPYVPTRRDFLGQAAVPAAAAGVGAL